MKKKQNITFLVLIFCVVVLSLIVVKISHSDNGFRQNMSLTEYLAQKQEQNDAQRQAGLVKLNLDYQAHTKQLVSNFLDQEKNLGQDLSARKVNTDGLIEKLLTFKVVKEQKDFHLGLVVLLTKYSDVLSAGVFDEVEQKNDEIYQFLHTQGWNI
jgi:hypothetical protein